MREIERKITAGQRRQAHRCAPRSADRGSTLLEVLVVATILLVGILTVVRVFPIGFDVVERGGYVTMANRYAQTLLDDLRSNPAALPDGILPAVYLGAAYQGTRWWVNDDALTPADLEAKADVGGDAGLRSFANGLVQFRRIYQETTRVPRAAYTVAGTEVSRYVVRFAPIENYEAQAPAAGDLSAYDMMTVYSLASFVKVDRDALGRYDGRDGYYAIDPDEDDSQQGNVARQIYFSRVSYRRTFKIDFALRPVNTNPNDYDPDAVQYVTDRIVWVDANLDPADDASAAQDANGTVNLGDGTSVVLVPDSEVVRRRLRDARAEPGSGDPYWYVLDNPTVGVLRFSASTAGMPVGVNYSVMDWGILHDDVDVPLDVDPGQGSLAAADQLAWVKLSFPFVERTSIGAPQETDSSGTVVVQGDSRPGMSQAIIIQDIDANSPRYGLLIDPDNNNDGNSDGRKTWTFDDPQRGTDASLAGRIGLRVAKLSGVRRVRIFYRTRDGFSAQVLKPYASYMPIPPTARTPSYNRYRSSGARLYLALSDVGKSVAVDYSYQDTDADDATSLRRVVGEMHTVARIRATLDSAVGPGDYGYFDLNVPGGNAAAIRSIDAVRGVSLEVRVLWPKRGVPNRMYKILQTGWSGTAPSFWDEDGTGRMLQQSVTAAVAKPAGL